MEPRMSENALDAAISAFERLLPAIKDRYGASWAVVAEDSLQGAFDTYGEATAFAVGRFEPGTFLVRHTQSQAPYIPFLVVEA